MRSQQSNNQVENLAQQAEELARKQQDFEGEMRRQFGAERARRHARAGRAVGRARTKASSAN